MTLDFAPRRERARLLLPDGQHVERVVEIRTHPLTGDTGRILAVPVRPLRVPDLRTEYAATREGCPFCPEALEGRTPRFSPEEFEVPRFAAGQARVFPNLLAYAGVCALTVLSEEHFVPLPALSPDLLLDGFRAARAFFQACREARPELGVRLLHWNFMPPAGSSILHPHQQLMATQTAPTRLRRLAEGAARYRQETRGDAWAALVERERREGARWVGATPPWSWFTDPVPQGRYFELVGVHDAHSDVADLREEDLRPLCSALEQVFAYLDSNGLWSFNLALMGLPAAAGGFRCQVRVVPRAFLPPAGCADVHFDVIQNESMVLRAPEEVASELRAYFPEGSG